MAGTVYVLEEFDQNAGTATGYYKVGMTESEDYGKRLGDLQTGNPRPLVPVRAERARDMKTAEKEAQKAVGKLPSVTRQVIKDRETEWFYLPLTSKGAFLATFDSVIKCYQ